MANTTKGAKPQATAEKTFTKAELDAIVAEAVKQALANAPTAELKSSVTVSEEMVTLLFIGGIAKGTTVSLGGLGKINRDGGTIDIPKKQFLQGIDEIVDGLLADRKLIVLDGLTDEERERYGVLYAPDELLTQRQFLKMLEYSTEDICAIFKKLCEKHKETVAKVFTTARSEGDSRITLEKVQALNDISLETREEGLFERIIEDIGATLTPNKKKK